MEIVLDAFSKLHEVYTNAILVLAMRFPEEIKQFYATCSEHYSVAKRSEDPNSYNEYDILLVDTIGELHWIYGAGHIVFVGGSFVPAGGHNLIEPAMWSIPIITGLVLFNFSDVSKQLVEAGAQCIVQDRQELGVKILKIIEDDDLSHEMGVRGKIVAEQYSDSLEFLDSELTPLLKGLSKV